MTLSIEDLEQRRYPVKPVSAVAMLRRLTEEPGLKQKDLLDVFGTGSAVSQVLNHRRRTAFQPHLLRSHHEREKGIRMGSLAPKNCGSVNRLRLNPRRD